MKIDKKRLVEIINEEYEMMHKHNHHSRGEFVDKEGDMASSQLEHIAKYAIEVHQMLEPYGENIQLEAWVQNKLTLAKDYISKIKHYLEHELNVSNDNLPED